MAKSSYLLACCATALLLAACSPKEQETSDKQPATTPAEQQIVFPTQKLDKNITAFSEIADKSMPPLVLTVNNNPTEVNNCQQFINHIAAATVDETISNMHVYAEYQPCVISRLVDQAKPSNARFFQENFSSTIIDQLDLSSFASSLGPRLEENKKTLAAFEFSSMTESNHKVEIQDEGWAYEFTLLASGDFTGDGIEDLLVRFLDQSGDASYFSLQTLILEKPDEKSQVSANNAIKFLR